MGGIFLDYEKYMQIALGQAKIASELLEVPIGCVIVHGDSIIATGYNQRNTNKNPLHHAEILAIDTACKHLGDWRLEDCTIFVTVEPCPMCAGAILQARIAKLVYGAKNSKAGSVNSIQNILENDMYNHKVEVISGVMEEECGEIMSNFFTGLRQKNC